MGRDGLILIDKPVDVSSRFVVNRVMRTLNIRKVGHFGTLDPFATGVLCVGVGQATKLLPFMPAREKEYIALVGFEKFTDTDDHKGQALEEFENVKIDLSEVQGWLDNNQGWISQVPPDFCAQKQNGKPLYKLKRQQQEVKPRAKDVHIVETEVLDSGDDWLRLRVVCSRGTYIRSIARDLGRFLGTGGYLRELRRLRSEGFSIEQAIALNDLNDEIELLPMAEALDIVKYKVGPEAEREIMNGRPILKAWLPEDPALDDDSFFAVLNQAGALICVARVKRDGAIIGRVERGFNP